MIFSSCTYGVYQVYKVVPDSNIVQKENNLVYEDNNCKIIYDLWSEGGDIGFLLYNKTSSNIYLNVEESFFIVNGIAYNYFKNRTFSNSSNQAIALTYKYSSFNSNNMTSIGETTSRIEEKIIIIPPSSGKYLREYKIQEEEFKNCDFVDELGNSKKSKTLIFDKSNSPIKCSNKIKYTVGKNGQDIDIENSFYISEISNCPAEEITDLIYKNKCGRTDQFLTEQFKNPSPNKFYIKLTSINKGYIYPIK